MEDWQEILSRYGPAAWRAAYRITGNRDDADECLQEALFSALELSRRAKVRHWSALLLRLVTARAVDRLRERRLQSNGHISDWGSLEDSGAPRSAEVEDAELVERLRYALGRISPRQAEVFCLHCEGFTYDQIAQQLAVSVAAVGVHLHRARERLRGLLSSFLDNSRDLRTRRPDRSRSASG